MVMHRLIRGLYHHSVTLEHWIILGLLMLLGVAWLRLRRWAGRGTRRAMTRARRAGAGERAAEVLLEAEGYGEGTTRFAVFGGSRWMVKRKRWSCARISSSSVTGSASWRR